MAMKRGQMWAPFKVYDIETMRAGTLFGVMRQKAMDTGYVRWEDAEKSEWVPLMDLIKQENGGNIEIR